MGTPIWLLMPTWRGLVIMFALVVTVLLAHQGYTASGVTSVVGAISTLAYACSGHPKRTLSGIRAKLSAMRSELDRRKIE